MKVFLQFAMTAITATTGLMLALFGQVAQASYHTANVCAHEGIKVCAHLMHESPLTSQDEGKFIIHFVSPNQIENLKVSLWMEMEGHGHGSAPVEVEVLEGNQFRVRNAWFVMPGTWLVRLQFQVQDQIKNINIPITITE